MYCAGLRETRRLTLWARVTFWHVMTTATVTRVTFWNVTSLYGTTSIMLFFRGVDLSCTAAQWTPSIYEYSIKKTASRSVSLNWSYMRVHTFQKIEI